MSILVKIVLAAVWMLLIPGGAGSCLAGNKKDLNPVESLVLGYVVFFCLGEVLILPATVLKLPLHVVTLLFGGIMICLAVLGYGLLFRPARKEARRVVEERRLSADYLYLIAAVFIIILQTVVVVLLAHMDADDAFYVGTATTSVRTDSVFSVNPYTGFPYESLPSRYVLSPFPILLAVFSSFFGNLHPAIVAHMIYPAVLIPLSYMVLFLLAQRLFPKDRKSQGIFLLILSVLGWFSAYSIYNSDNFRAIRIWQGKAVLAGCFLPLLFYLCVTILVDEERRYAYGVLAMALTGACLLSSMGILLTPLVVGIFLVISIFRRRSLLRFLGGVLCLLPVIALGVVYILIR